MSVELDIGRHGNCRPTCGGKIWLPKTLRHIGRPNVTPQVVDVLRRQIKAADRKPILKDLRYAPAWIADVLRQLASDKAAVS